MATEKRLIDANALDGILKDFESRYQKACFALSAKAIANARQIVYAMKTVDAVEVVRCKDCKYGEPMVGSWDNKVWCGHHKCFCPEDGFCSYGERNGNG